MLNKNKIKCLRNLTVWNDGNKNSIKIYAIDPIIKFVSKWQSRKNPINGQNISSPFPLIVTPL